MAGHVFIARGDLTRLFCHAYLMSSDANLYLEASWRRAFPDNWIRGGMVDWERAGLPQGWGGEAIRAIKLDSPQMPWPPDRPQPYLVNVGSHGGRGLSWYLDGARAFLETAWADLRKQQSFRPRVRPLVALPAVGIGRGGAHFFSGDVIRELLRLLYEEVEKYDMDIVLMTYTSEAFAAAQAARASLVEERDGRLHPWADLSPAHLERAKHLADQAARDQLVLFLGAGVSAGAGLPLWEELLEELAEQAGMPASRREHVRSLNVLDRARLIKRELATQGRDLAHDIRALLEQRPYALCHALLAGLPVREVVTQNYDTLFEDASLDQQRRCAVLPHEPTSHAQRWLLKMHGCIHHPDTIVLTRADYLRYTDRRAALAGIVQALLITRTLLFVGFSMNDDNFHRIADDVRKALRPGGQRSDTQDPFGVALSLGHDPLVEELWEGDLSWLSLRETERDQQHWNNEPQNWKRNQDEHWATTVGWPARRLEIFLDHLLFLTSTRSGHLLNPAFDGVLKPSERALRDTLNQLRDTLLHDPRLQGLEGSHAHQRILELFLELGMRDLTSR